MIARQTAVQLSVCFALDDGIFHYRFDGFCFLHLAACVYKEFTCFAVLEKLATFFSLTSPVGQPVSLLTDWHDAHDAWLQGPPR